MAQSKGGAGLSYDPLVHSQGDLMQILIQPRAAYLGELLRQVAHVSKRVIAVVDEGLLPHIEDKWQKLPRTLESLESFYKMPLTLQQKNQLDKKTASKISILDQQETWLEFIEKQVIMDVLFEPFLYRNFV